VNAFVVQGYQSLPKGPQPEPVDRPTSEGAKCSNDHNLLANLLFFSQTWYLYQNQCCLVTNKWRLNNIILQIVTMFSTMLQV
jgi:hypothetical protein